MLKMERKIFLSVLQSDKFWCLFGAGILIPALLINLGLFLFVDDFHLLSIGYPDFI